MTLQTPKGMRDFNPEEKILRNEIVRTLTEIFELYGYVPLETPIVERYDVLSAKFAAGEESDVLKEIFKLKDQGNRELGLRFDLTVPLARYIAMNQDLKMPFKRFQTGEVFRDGPIKLGRYREFWQCDADAIGVKSVLAEYELIKIALDFFKEMNFDAYIQVNNRKLVEGILIDSGIKENEMQSAMISIDKHEKIGLKGVLEEMKKSNINDKAINNIKRFLSIEDVEKIEKIIKNDIAKQGLNELKGLFKLFSKKERKNVKFRLSLVRGFSYYTGIVFEGFLRKNEIKSSICGGGRYDNMIGNYMEEKKEVPAVGISFGLDTIADAIKIKAKKTNVKVYLIPIKTEDKTLKIIEELRKNKINSDMDMGQRNLSKNLDYANKLDIPYVLIIGNKEIKMRKYTLRDMKTGKEQMLDIKKIIKKLCNF